MMNNDPSQNGAGYGPGGYVNNPAGIGGVAAREQPGTRSFCENCTDLGGTCSLDIDGYGHCSFPPGPGETEGETITNRPPSKSKAVAGASVAAPPQNIQQQLAAEGVSWPLPEGLELRPIPGTSRMRLCCRYEGGECCEVGSGGCFGILVRCLRGRVKRRQEGTGAGGKPLGTRAARGATPWSGMQSSTRASIGQIANPDACCESCAFGGHCDGDCGDDCDCDRKGNPASNP
jgi:hypothetical protein